MLVEQTPPPSNNADDDGEQALETIQYAMEKPLIIDLEEKKIDASKRKAGSPLRVGRGSKNKISSYLSRAFYPPEHPSPDIFLPSHQLLGTNLTNLAFTNNYLPVLGLCAPNANQMESSHRKFSRSNVRQSRPGAGPEFPFSLAPQSGTLTEKEVNTESITNRMKLSDALQDVSQQHFKSGIPDGRLPHSLVIFMLSLLG